MITKKSFVPALIVLACACGFAEADVPPGAMALYCFASDGVVDLSGNGRDGVLSGDAVVVNDVLQLSGNGYLEVPGVCTACNGSGAYTVYIKKLTTSINNASIYSVGQDGQDKPVTLFTSGANLRVDFWYEWQQGLTSSVNFADNTPHEFFLTYSGGAWTIYDGAAQAAAASRSYTVPCGSVRIGETVSPGQKGDLGLAGLAGTMEAVAVYDRVLTATERADLMDSVCNRTPLVEFELPLSGQLETASPALVPVVLYNAAAGQNYTVDYSVSGGTAQSPADYTLASGTLTFVPGDTVETISIAIVDDGQDEDDETIMIALSNPVGTDLELGGIAQHTYTIIDPRPSVGFDVGSSVGPENAQIIHRPRAIPVSLSSAAASTVTVNYASVTGGTATRGLDFVVVPGTLVFQPGGSLTQYVPLTVVDDALEETSETVVLQLSDPSGAKLGTSGHVYTIEDDDTGAQPSDKDLNGDGSVDIGDLAFLLEGWLECTLESCS